MCKVSQNFRDSYYLCQLKLTRMLKKVLKESDIKRLSALLSQSERIVLTCHVRPDGDAIGSTLGFCHVLRAMGKDARVIAPDAAPKSLSFLPGFKDILTYSKYPDYSAKLVAEADLLICCDFNCLKRLDDFQTVISESAAKKVLIDHHTEPEYFCDLTFSFPSMSSTCELVFRILAALGMYIDMNLDTATCLCTGLITDTQNFAVNCSDPEVYEVLMRLLDKGVDKPKIVREALVVKSLESFRLQSYALSEKLELYEDGHAAIVTLDKDELNRFNYQRGDSEGVVNRPLEIKDVICSFFLREDPDCIKVSARSINNFPVNAICKQLFGGGGHVMAAGGEYTVGTIDDCRSLLIEAFQKYKNELKEALDKSFD